MENNMVSVINYYYYYEIRINFIKIMFVNDSINLLDYIYCIGIFSYYDMYVSTV